jgi:hypothetical protein
VIGYNSFIRKLRGHDPQYLSPGERVVNNQGFEAGKGASKKFLYAELEALVVDADPKTQVIKVRDAEIQAYKVVIQNPKNREEFEVFQPLDRAHYKAVLKYLAGLKDWPNYFFLKNHFPDLRPRDASTVYKAQGSTFETVYIDLQNIGTSNVANQVARMLYVAVSRARSQVFMYGRLPAKYSGG